MSDVPPRGWVDRDAAPEVSRVVRSVLPAFDHHRDRPDRIGSCLLVRIDGHALVLTAAHVFDELGADRLFTIAVGGVLLAIPGSRFASQRSDPADIGIIPVRPTVEEMIKDAGGLFLDGSVIDESERADGMDVLNRLAHTYVAVGYPASRALNRIQHVQRKMEIKTYSARLTLAPTGVYPDGLSGEKHLLLEFPQDGILQAGKPVNPPKLQGMSGGGVFRFRRRQPDTLRLVGVLIEHHKNVEVIAATRVSTAAALAREVIARHPDTFA